jgi:hypothetical protein
MPQQFSRRAFLRAGGVALAGLAGTAIAAACGDDDEAPAATQMNAQDANLRQLVSGWYKGRSVRYYDFGDQTKLTQGNSIGTAPIYAFTRGMKADGTPDLVAGQGNVIDVRPGDAGYSDLWQVMLVTVPATYTANSVKSRAEITAQGLPVTQTNMLVNCPVVASGTKLEGGEKLVQGWYRGQEVFYPDFGANPAAAIPIWAFITGMDERGMPRLVQGQSNIIDSVPADPGYSAFWRVNLVTVPSGYVANTIKAADAIRSSGYSVMQTDMVVNCPVVSVA